MKKILLLFALASTLLCKAQPADMLFQHTWYLWQISIDGQTQIPYNPELSNVVLDITETPPYSFNLVICKTLNGEVTFPEWEKMLFPTTLSETGDSCTQSENSDFEALLFNFFQSQIGVELTYYASVVDFDPPNYYLTIFLPNGDFVEFTEVPNPVLSVESFDKKMFSVYPNPVSERINVRNLTAQNISKIRLLSIQGSVLMETENSYLNTANLSRGMYLMEIIAENGDKQVEKILKK